MILDIPTFLFSILFGLSPILISIIAYFIIRTLKKNSLLEKVFLRLTLAFIIFNVFYIYIPAFINLINPPEKQYLYTTLFIDLDSSGSFTVGYWEASLNSFIRYWLQVIINSFLTFLFYPFALIPIIFILGAFISFILVLYQLRKTSKGGSLGESLALLQFGYEENPFTLMYEKLTKSNYESAWDLFKILIAVLPISLYLLMTLLKVTGNQENPNILQGTSLGWFLEIFFVYLASVMFSVHLLYSSKLSYKGDFLGLKLRNAMVQSLSTVGTLMSSIAIVLFVIDFSRQFFVVIYFISYFIMVTLFFVLFLDIFEPFSIYIVTKFIEYFKRYSAVTIKKEPTTISSQEPKTPKTEIFVPSVNLNELANPESNIESKSAQNLNMKTETKTEEKIIESKIEITKSLNQLLLKSSTISGFKIVFTLLLYFIFIQLFEYLVFNVFRPGVISYGPSLTVIFIVLFLFFCIPLIISILLFSKHNLKVVGIAITFHFIIVILDWALRYALIQWSGTDKFETLNYLSSYYFLEFYIFVIFLSLAILLMRKYNWNSFTNVGWIFVTGLIMSATWLLFFQTGFQLNLPFTGQTILKSVNVGAIGDYTPAATFPSLVDGITQQNSYWVTYIFRDVQVQSTGISLVVVSLSTVPVNLVPFLYVFSLFFNLFQSITVILLYGLIFYLAGLEFLTVAYKDDEKVDKIVYSERLTPLNLNEVVKTPYDFAVSRNFGLGDENEVKAGFTVTQIEESIYQLNIGAHLIQFISEAPVTFADLQEESLLSFDEILKFFDEISKINLSKAKPFLLFTKEYGFEYEEANLDSLHVMMVDGRSVFTHNFKEESTVEPALVAGLFSAITSFAKETVKSEQLLRTIDHGDVVLMIEYGQYVFSAIFADKNSVELRSKLASFVKEFEKKHVDELSGWLGDTSPFADDWMLVNNIFEMN